MRGEYKNAESIAIIGGEDGPTSIFLVNEKNAKLSFKFRIKEYIYNYKRKKTEKEIVAGVHTLEEVIAYATNKYGAIESAEDLNDLPVVTNIYKIKEGCNCLEIEIDYTRDTFGVSFSGSQKAMRKFKKIAKDLYIYYGVSENDISKKTERYLSLLSILSN